jgi:hypothetical protein
MEQLMEQQDHFLIISAPVRVSEQTTDRQSTIDQSVGSTATAVRRVLLGKILVQHHLHYQVVNTLISFVAATSSTIWSLATGQPMIIASKASTTDSRSKETTGRQVQAGGPGTLAAGVLHTRLSFSATLDW